MQSALQFLSVSFFLGERALFFVLQFLEKLFVGMVLFGLIGYLEAVEVALTVVQGCARVRESS